MSNELMSAASENSIEEFSDFLENHGIFDLNVRDENDWTALIHAASKNSDERVVEHLIMHGADLNARGKDGMTALMHAIADNPNCKIAQLLI